VRVTKPRARRYPFNATIELTDLESEVEVRGQTNDLSLFGCHVNTLNPMAAGSRVRIRISHVSGVFTALGRVAHAGTKGDLGVYFTSIEPTNQLMLEKWVDEIRQLCRTSGNTYVRVKNR
jgi:hypothetical protein